MPRRPIVGGNWKCNPADIAALDGLVANINACDTSRCDVYVCPSLLHVGMVYKSFTNGAKVAPQNCNFKGCGAYTGEMAADQMKGMGIQWCMVGHSERRGEFGLPTPAESNELIAGTKLGYLLEKGLKVVLAIGEPLPIREQGLEAVVEYCKAQLVPGIEHFKTYGADKIVIAYEPVWSIGTGVTASPAQAQETHAALRKYLSEAVSPEFAEAVRIQYGGSANAKNAPELSACPDVDGFLVGGASLKPEFKDIVAAIAEVKKADTPFEAMYKKCGLEPVPGSACAWRVASSKSLSPEFEAMYLKSGLVHVEGCTWKVASASGAGLNAVRASRPTSAKAKADDPLAIGATPTTTEVTA